ncbi:IS1634 family transposase [Paraburkholderia sp. 1N]|uniref:IS1634 family transposase n=1 Tax=Paraburkholderia solitsugae TaxID=2675748 RepID=A0ABX2BMC0_9BURK|nr:IS1634 family transposase [Paraburkholderia solitsugae]NPT41230.1 IS1634 family transposase [Paraburkholderia solitsugae]
MKTLVLGVAAACSYTVRMFLKRTQRIKDGKTHHYWSVVENRRLINGKVMQRQVLYLGEINDSQKLAWRKSIEVFDEGTRRQVALFADDALPADDARAIGVRLSEMQLKRPRQWGACWLSCVLWQQLGMDEFWSARLPASRKGTRWLQVLQTLVAYRLIDPGSEWRLHRHWFTSSAMADLLDADFALAGKDTLYRCLDKLLPHKDALMLFLKQRWGELFGASFDVLLYDLTSTYFESDTPREAPDKRQYGYSRDKRGDCRQVVIGLIVTPEGFPLSYEVLPGNTADCTTLSDLLRRIEARYGKANRTWVMDRGIPTEETLAQMREMGASYLVGTPKGRLSKLEQSFLSKSWERIRDGVHVKRLPQDSETYVLAESEHRIGKERGMRQRRLKRYVQRLKQLQGQGLTRDELLMKVGAARQDAGRAAYLIRLTLPQSHEAVTPDTFHFELDRARLRRTRRREGRYLLRTNLTGHDPGQLWTFYTQLTEVEQAFKELKHDLSIRPIYHFREERIEAHIFVAFLAYCLQVTLKNQLRRAAPGLTPRAVLEKFKTMQMVDVHLPTTDGRDLILSRYTQPEPEHRLLLDHLRLTLPAQPPPKITARPSPVAATKTYAL